MRIRARVPFAIIPEWVLIAPDLSDRAVRLYGLLVRVADESGAGETSKARLAGRLKRSVDTVDRAIRELLEIGALSMEPMAHGDFGFVLESAPPPPEEEMEVPASAADLRPSSADLRADLRTAPLRESPREESIRLRTADMRQDVERLCSLLADLIKANGSRRPSVGQGWRDAARLLLDRDGRSEREVEAVIRWSQADEFWRANILSMPKLRAKFDQLRLQMNRRRAAPKDRAAEIMAGAEALARAQHPAGRGRALPP